MNGYASDFAGQLNSVGWLAFRRRDATFSTTYPTPTGYAQHSLTLLLANEPDLALGLANRETGFAVRSTWDFVRPDPGSSIQLTLSSVSPGLGSTGTSNESGRPRLRLFADFQAGERVYRVQACGARRRRFDLDDPERHSLSALSQAIFFDLPAVDHLEQELSRALPSAGDTSPASHVQMTISMPCSTLSPAIWSSWRGCTSRAVRPSTTASSAAYSPRRPVSPRCSNLAA